MKQEPDVEMEDVEELIITETKENHEDIVPQKQSPQAFEEDETEKPESECRQVKVYSIALKAKYKTFVNVGDDCIFMRQRIPDFFLIDDQIKRDQVIDEFLDPSDDKHEENQDLLKKRW